ncbi:MAG: HEAT repeat domain-containing protein [Bacteroidales bacterium]|nr:HEAT repeat domain-containing protein [Bacteroidales bacterium]
MTLDHLQYAQETKPTPQNPEEPNVSYGCCLALIRPALVMLLLFTAPRPETTAAVPEANMQERCLTVLRTGLTANEFWPSMHAAEALSLAGHGKEVLKALSAKTATDDQQRCGLAREAYRAGDHTRAMELLTILDKPGSNGHTHAAESLFKIGVIGDGVKLRQACTQNANLKLKLMAAAALHRGGDTTAIDVVRPFVTHADSSARMIAAWVLGQIGQPRDIPALAAQAKKETEPLNAAYFAYALALLGDANGRKVLGENLRSTDTAVRTYAADFAGLCRATEFRERLIALLDDANLDTRIRAAEAILLIDHRSTAESSIPANGRE